MIKFNYPVKAEWNYIQDIFETDGIVSGDGKYTKLCSKWFEEQLLVNKLLLTTSGTAALEMAAVLCNLQPQDEVIMPSYTFCSTANAFVMRGARIKFIDVRPDTMNMDETLIENAITDRTKVIVPVHYAGVACEMDDILHIAKKYNLLVVEDAAQGVMGFYKGKALGTIGDYGCYSFHETKNYTMGEGGAICVNHSEDVERAEICREKGTNRSKYFRGEIDKYGWIDLGSSYLPSDINAAYLYPQLLQAEEINKSRLDSWHRYYERLEPLRSREAIELATIPKHCEHNAHMFWIKTKDLEERTKLISYLKENEINAYFHYVPLHSSPAGLKFGEFVGEDRYTTKDSERLLRLPLYYDMKESDIDFVVDKITEFYEKQ